MGISQQLYQKAKKIIPGGTQLLSKRPEMFLPNYWPAYYKKARGCKITDLDNKKYLDLSYMGIGACVLGYADPDVDRAVKKAISRGSTSTLNCPEEYQLAKMLCQIHPWAQMVRFARGGGEAMAVAVRIARANSKKDIVLFCGYHGWHDWYLSANLSDNKALDGHLLPGLNPLGVPRALTGSSFPFKYNDAEGFLRLVQKHRHKIGAVVMEPIRNYYPTQDFIKTIQKTVRKIGVALVIDEVSAGWRLNEGGAHLSLKIEPDIAVFAKAMGNGYPIAAIIGKKEFMTTAQDTFISSTNWTENIGPTAAITTLEKYHEKNVAKHLVKVGRQVQNGWRKFANKHHLDIDVGGIYPLSHFTFKDDARLTLKTLFTQLMLKNGFLATNAFYASYAHKPAHIKTYLSAVDKTFQKISSWIKSGHPEKYLQGPPSHAGFQRLN